MSTDGLFFYSYLSLSVEKFLDACSQRERNEVNSDEFQSPHFIVFRKREAESLMCTHAKIVVSTVHFANFVFFAHTLGMHSEALRGRSGRRVSPPPPTPPEMTYGFLIQLIFWGKNVTSHQRRSLVVHAHLRKILDPPLNIT